MVLSQLAYETRYPGCTCGMDHRHVQQCLELTVKCEDDQKEHILQYQLTKEKSRKTRNDFNLPATPDYWHEMEFAKPVVTKEESSLLALQQEKPSDRGLFEESDSEDDHNSEPAPAKKLAPKKPAPPASDEKLFADSDDSD
ncbi:expressed unknown protein [Seminavis robusta]|uniref:Uncharacterized protein n=1 Tax=Seminavis robusta TaxID=568900 RepID=A0A9N8DCQ8_9STRA|nr:expressed unknown protein [Seminavis robusta]|eukprot:Sro59_g034340.1 n/a (141) ;mRNA; f:121274-121696